MALGSGNQQYRILDGDEQKQWCEKIIDDHRLYDVDRDARTALLEATCPECGHDFVTTFSEQDLILDGPKSLGGSQASEDWEGTIQLLFRCTCSEPHPGRSNDVTSGCGAGAYFEDSEDGA